LLRLPVIIYRHERNEEKWMMKQSTIVVMIKGKLVELVMDEDKASSSL
jgi:hypothetical protein